MYFCCIIAANAQEIHELKDFVYSINRSAQRQDSIPIPVKVIGKKEIQDMGSRRLLEVLREQTSFSFVSDQHGSGLQMQGMDPAYTMILIDGQPLIGRLTGKFDLNRITVANVEQIEILKGASSALYGSEAMAGIVNIITKDPTKDTSVNIALRYGTFNTVDASGSASYAFAKQKAAIQLNADYYRTDGYAIAPDGSGFKNLPPYYSTTLQAKLNYNFTAHTTLLVSGRYGVRDQENKYNYNNNPQEDGTLEKDANLTGTLRHKFSDKWNSILTYYYNNYRTDEDIRSLNTGEKTDSSFFRQQMQRAEWQHNYSFSRKAVLTAGAGGVLESVNATRYPGKRTMSSGFAYAQQQCYIAKHFNTLLGLRGDWNSIYGGQLNPKMAAQYSASSKLNFRASAGRGFKAPDFRQLYMTFTNPTVGYSVLGTEEIAEEIAAMQAKGEIAELFPGAAERSEKALKPERSWSYNAGAAVSPVNGVKVNLNIFYNDLNDLIQSVAIGNKTNGQQLFSYINVSRSFTTGAEADMSWNITKNLELRGGYQYLIAKDRDIIDSIKSGKYTLTAPDGNKRTAVKADYVGLSGRSRHQANIKLLYAIRPWGIRLLARYNYMGSSVYALTSGNQFNTSYEKNTPAYGTLSCSIEKTFLQQQLAVQLSAENVTDYKNVLTPGQPGRQFFAGLRWNWKPVHKSITP